jgi:hypothetical protein
MMVSALWTYMEHIRHWKLMYLRLTPLCLNTCAGVCISSRSTWGHRNIYGHAGKGTAMVAARESVNEVSSIIPVPESADLFCGYYITCHSRISICGVSKSKGKTDSPLFCKEFWPIACMWCHSTFHPFPHNIPFLIVWREKWDVGGWAMHKSTCVSCTNPKCLLGL